MRQTDLRRAMEALSAVRLTRRYYAYEAADEGSPRWYAVTGDDLRDYGALLRRDEPDAYSVWCSSAPALRLGECRDCNPVPTLRARLRSAGG